MLSRNLSSSRAASLSDVSSMNAVSFGIADSLHIDGIADTAITIQGLVRMPIVEYLALGAAMPSFRNTTSYRTGGSMIDGDSVAHVMLLTQQSFRYPSALDSIMEPLDFSSVAHLRKVDGRWLIAGRAQLLVGDVGLGVMMAQQGKALKAQGVGTTPVAPTMSRTISAIDVASSTAAAPKASCDLPKNPYFEFQVDQPVRFIDDGKTSPKPSPGAPTATLVQFVVDTSGVPVDKTYRILKSVSVEFSDEILKVASSWRFEPARKGGCKVPQLVQTMVTK